MEDLQRFLQDLGLTVSYSPIKARCLFTTRDFSPGEVIISKEPYVCMPEITAASSVCHRCFASSDLKMCSACKVAWYCGSTCQKLDWKLHRTECRALSGMDKDWLIHVTPTIRLIVKLYVRRKLQSQKIIPTTATDNYKLVETLMTHFSNINPQQLSIYSAMAKTANAMLQWPEIKIEETIETLSKLERNQYTIYDSEMEPLGTGLYPVISIINHSCLPNSVLVFEGSLAVVRAVEHIPKGAEVFISYINTAWSTRTRQASLQKQYAFTCSCPRCINVGNHDDILDIVMYCKKDGCDGIMHGDDDEAKCQKCGLAKKELDKEERNILRRIKSMKGKTEKARSSGNTKEANSIFMMTEKLERKVFHPSSPFLVETRKGLIKNLMKQGDWCKALEYCRLNIQAYQRLYPGIDPMLGLEYYTCGKLEWTLGETEDAVKSLTKAVDILRIAYGTDTPFMKDLLLKLRKARAGWYYSLSSDDA